MCGELAEVPVEIVELRRFIPACAGNSFCPAPSRSRPPVHPRVCGELYRLLRGIRDWIGSSPRVRGTLRGIQAAGLRVRFIPACAGNSARGEQQSCPHHGSSPRVRGTLLERHPRHGNRRFIPACAGNSATRRLTVWCTPVHPRVCGELVKIALDPDSDTGSSPRVRGTLRRCWRRCAFRRFIPACAGNSTRTPAEAVIHCGSSPRVRGTRSQGHDRVDVRRFIPACAGNSAQGCRGVQQTAVHPRVCGELALVDDATAAGGGSSPRVRGTHRLPPIQPSARRFIPACAGNSARAPQASGLPTVHPRVCGELRIHRIWLSNKAGSSPRVRGTHHAVARIPRHVRFIPACAGNSPASPASPAPHPVHPRVCGELASAKTWQHTADGSSPRVRGTPRRSRSGIGPPPVHPRVCGELPDVRPPVGVPRRFIPACAGNSARGGPRRRPAPVHPRVCGELLRVGGRLVARHGSSPRVRGTPRLLADDQADHRFIPACAGNSEHRLDVLPGRAGSSPRVRGTLDVQPEGPDRRRFIPACAGNSWNRITSATALPVHPRVCGELGCRSAKAAGSSRFIPACAGNSTPTVALPPYRTVHPRVCGELMGPEDRGARRRRFIPACAGNSPASASPATARPVHPRVCGELAAAQGRPPAERRFIPACAGNSSFAPTKAMRCTGSSPRVRGTRPRSWMQPAGRRFIPACAGNSSPALPPALLLPVHPRVCGELLTLLHLQANGVGSSPRVRGTPKRTASRRSNRRFIPACAGNSKSCRSTPSSPPVHPRVCGELQRGARAARRRAGSSPRVRGTRESRSTR